MDAQQISKYNMLLKVDDFFDDHTADTASHSQIGPKHDALETVIDNIQLVAAEAIADHTGVTEDKAAVRLQLEQQTFTALTALLGLARDTANNKLKRRVGFTLSDLQGMRDAVLHFNATVVHSMATTHSAALAGYAYTPAQLAALEATLTDFLDITTEPKDAIEERAVANKQVAALLKQADGLLADLDVYMNTFRFSNVPLWDEYQLARAIDDAGGGTGGGNGETLSASGTLAPMLTLAVLNFTYDGGLTYRLSNNGPAMQMEVVLMQNGMPVPGAQVMYVNAGMPMEGKLHQWGPVADQLQLRNTDMGQSLTYQVELLNE
jgi:hypothetical protein